MASIHSSANRHKTQGVGPDLAEVKAILDSVDASALIARLWQYRWNTRPGYPLSAMFRAHLLRFLLNLPSVNALIRRLQEDPRLRRLCGFGQQMPHRSTFNRFYSRLSDHRDLVEKALASLTDHLAGLLPGFGEKIAVDSTNVGAHSNPDKPTISDPDASWTGKAKAAPKGRTEWHFGYKYHALVDAQYGLPITGFTTTASRNDNPTLPDLLDKAAKTYGWFSPTFLMADKGYDSEANHREALDRGVVPIIPIRRLRDGATREGILDAKGVPVCVGNIPMEYVTTDAEKGHLYRCAQAGCPLADRKGVRYCDDEQWVHWQDSPRVVGAIRRDSQEWKDLYGLRQSVERVFKSLKQSRALNSHCLRGLRKVGVHALLSVLAFQATALRRLRTGQVKWLRWQVQRVA